MDVKNIEDFTEEAFQEEMDSGGGQNNLTPEEREKKIMENYNLIFYAISQLHLNRGSMDFEDIVNEGAIALIKAVDNYKEGSASFSTYAVKAIERAIVRFINRNKPIRLPDWVLEERGRMESYKKKHPQTNLEKEFGTEAVYRQESCEHLLTSLVYGDAPVQADDGNSVSIFSAMADKDSEFEEDVITGHINEGVREYLKSLSLCCPERQALAERVLLDDDCEGLTAMEIWELKKWYIARLRNPKVIRDLKYRLGIPWQVRPEDIPRYLYE